IGKAAVFAVRSTPSAVASATAPVAAPTTPAAVPAARSVAAWYREKAVSKNSEIGRLRCPFDALGRCVGYGAGCGSHHASGGPCSPLGGRLVSGEGGVQELRVGLDGLPRELLPRFLLPVCLLGEPLGTCAAGLGLLPEVARHEL